MANNEKKQEFLNKIVKLAAEKPEFKEKLLQNPQEAIQSLVSFTLPEQFEIVVHEDTPNKINIVLPDTSGELSEIELAAISGGDEYWDWWNRPGSCC